MGMEVFFQKTTSSSLSAGTLNASSVHGRDFSTLSSRSANNPPPNHLGPLDPSDDWHIFLGIPLLNIVGSIRPSVGGPWIPINLYGFLWFPKGISVTKRKKKPGKIQMPWSSDERRSDSWAPSWTTPTFGGEALDLDPPQGQPPHHHRFWDVKTSVFFSWEKVYQNPEGFEKKNININVIMWPWREILHQGLWIPWATFCRQRLCWKNRRDFEKSNKRLVGKIHGKKGTKKKPLEIWHTQVN